MKKAKKTTAKKLMKDPYSDLQNQENMLIQQYPEEYKLYQMAHGGKLPQYGFGSWFKKNAGTIGSVVGGGIGLAVGGPAGMALGSSLGGSYWSL